VGMLAPVIGIVQIGEQGHADRYTYLPHIGLFLLIVWTAADFSTARRLQRKYLWLVATATIAILSYAAAVQASFWKNSEGLWNHTLSVTSNNDFAHNNLGFLYLRRGELDKAVWQWQKALEMQPNDAEAHLSIGNAFLQKSRPEQAIAHYQKALEVDPREVTARNNMAWVLATSSDASLRNGAMAVNLATQAVEISGGKDAIFFRTLAASYGECGRFADAIAAAEKGKKLAISRGDFHLASTLRSEEH